jgi:hypothetical protein
MESLTSTDTNAPPSVAHILNSPAFYFMTVISVFLYTTWCILRPLLPAKCLKSLEEAVTRTEQSLNEARAAGYLSDTSYITKLENEIIKHKLRLSELRERTTAAESPFSWREWLELSKGLSCLIMSHEQQVVTCRIGLIVSIPLLNFSPTYLLCQMIIEREKRKGFQQQIQDVNSPSV